MLCYDALLISPKPKTARMERVHGNAIGGGGQGTMDPNNLGKAPQTPLYGPQNHKLWTLHYFPWRPPPSMSLFHEINLWIYSPKITVPLEKKLKTGTNLPILLALTDPRRGFFKPALTLTHDPNRLAENISSSSLCSRASFTARRVCIARTMPWQDVCPSVCLSHAGIPTKRLNIIINVFFTIG